MDLEDLRNEMRDEMRDLRNEMRDGFRANGVRFELMDARMSGLAEAITSTREQLSREIADVRDDLSRRIDVLEQVVREHSEQLQKQSEQLQKQSAAIAKNSEQIRKNSRALLRNSRDIRAIQAAVDDLRRRFDQFESRDLEARVLVLEKRAGIG